MDRRALGDDRAIADRATGFVQSISKDGQKHNRRNKALESEEILHLCVRNTQKRKLQQEIQQEGDHACTGNTLVRSDIVRDILEAGPDGCEEHFHALAACSRLHTEPYDRQHSSAQHDKVREVIPKRHPRQDGERCMQRRSHASIDRNHRSHQHVTEHTSPNRHPPAQSYLNHGTRYLPVRDGPGVGHPVGDISAPVPGPLGRRDGVEVGIGSAFGFREGRFFASHFETEAWEAVAELAHCARLCYWRDGRGGR